MPLAARGHTLVGGAITKALRRHRRNIALLRRAEGHRPLPCPGCGASNSYHVGHSPSDDARVLSTMWGRCDECGFEHVFAVPLLGYPWGDLRDGMLRARPGQYTYGPWELFQIVWQ